MALRNPTATTAVQWLYKTAPGRSGPAFRATSEGGYQPQKAIVPPVQQVAHSETRGHEIGQGFGIGLGM